MIDRVSIQNFKSLRQVTIDLARLTVFVGPNASGKSSILEAMNYLCLASLGSVEPGIHTCRSRGTDGAIELTAKISGVLYRYRTHSSGTTGGGRHGKPGGTEVGFAVSTDEGTTWKAGLQDFYDTPPLPSAVLLRLETSKLTQPSQGPDPTVMASDGTGLHVALANMALNDPDSWRNLQADLRHIIPSIRRLRHTPVRVGQSAELLFDAVGADSLLAAQVSEGTLLVLGMLAALHAPKRPNLILLDDLDRGLHPRAQKEWIALLRRLQASNRDLQILATTHSPYLLDCVEPEEVRMTYLNEEGSTECAALTQHPKYDRWKEEFHPGEMWSFFGEKWVTDKGAVPEATAP